MYETTAIYMALCDLKRPVIVKVYYNGYVHNDDYNVSKKLYTNMKKLNNGKLLLQTHKIFIKYISLPDKHYSDKNSPEYIIRGLNSRCKQIRGNFDKQSSLLKVDFTDLQNAT